MPTADAYSPNDRDLIALDGEADDARAGRVARRKELRLHGHRTLQWNTKAGRKGERAEVLDAAFDELEVAR